MSSTVSSQMVSRPRLSAGNRLALAAFALLYPFHATVTTPVGGMNASAGDALVPVILLLFIGGLLGRQVLPRAFLWTLPFLAVSILSCLLSPFALGSGGGFNLSAGITAGVKLVASATWMVAVYLLVRANPVRAVNDFAAVLALAAAVFATVTVAQGLGGGRSPSGPFQNPNIYANWLLLNLYLVPALVWSPADTGFGRWKRMYLLALPVLAVGILATGSRGTLLGMAVSLPFAFSLRQVLARMTVMRSAAIAVMVLVTGAAGAWYWTQNSAIAARISGLATGEGPNIASRLMRWEAAIDAWSSSPVFGVGYGQFAHVAEISERLGSQQTHNSYLSAAAETGVLGLGAFLLLLGGMVWYGYRRTRLPEYRHLRFVVAFIVATAVQGIGANVDNFRSLWIAFGIIGALHVAPLLPRTSNHGYQAGVPRRGAVSPARQPLLQR